jgi:DNA (cytosine-5)-methyltransferase 1
MLKVLDLFSGIGGFSLGLERTGGFETVAFCEIEKFPQKVLAKHWPRVPIYEDVRNVTAKQLRSDGIIPNVITGGFPCQDISVAGNQKGMGEGTRSGLWSECARLLGEIRPDYAIFENVTALLSGDSGRWFQRVLWDLSEVGYDAEWHCIPASELGANHHRDRVWIIAYPNLQRCKELNTPAKPKEQDQLSRKCNEGSESPSPCGDVAYPNSSQREGGGVSSGVQAKHAISHSKGGAGATSKIMADTAGIGQQKQGKYEQSIFAEAYREGKTANALTGGSPDIWKVEPELGRVADGIRDRSHRLKGLGNAVVPQIPELIGRAILEAENEAM